MIAAIIVLIIELIMLLVVAPFKVAVNVRFCLDRNKCFICLRVFGIEVLKIKLENENERIRMLINGKIQRSRHNESSRNASGIIGYVIGEKVIKKIVCLGVIGGETAEDSAYNFGLFSSLICALVPFADVANVYPDFKSDRLDFEIKINAKISVYQTLRALAA